MTLEAPSPATHQTTDYEPAYTHPRNPQDTKSRSHSGTRIGPDDKTGQAYTLHSITKYSGFYILE